MVVSWVFLVEEISFCKSRGDQLEMVTISYYHEETKKNYLRVDTGMVVKRWKPYVVALLNIRTPMFEWYVTWKWTSRRLLLRWGWKYLFKIIGALLDSVGKHNYEGFCGHMKKYNLPIWTLFLLYISTLIRKFEIHDSMTCSFIANLTGWDNPHSNPTTMNLFGNRSAHNRAMVPSLLTPLKMKERLEMNGDWTCGDSSKHLQGSLWSKLGLELLNHLLRSSHLELLSHFKIMNARKYFKDS